MKESDKARAHTNITLIRYWEKTDEDLIIPTSNSLSVTLERFYTEAHVTFDDSLTGDQLTLNKEAVSTKGSAKTQRYMDMIRKKAGISMYALVESNNFVPTTTSLASSASVYTALAGICNEVLDLNLSDKGLSRFTCCDSGSASGSIYDGFAEWEKGYGDKTPYAHQTGSDGFESNLVIIFVVINDKSERASSRSDMSLARDISCLYQYWLDHVGEDLKVVKQVTAQRDFKRIGEVIEVNDLRMHTTNLGAQPPFTYFVSESYEAMGIVYECRETGLPCYFTMNAEPDVKVLIEEKHQQTVMNQFLEVFSRDQTIINDITYTGVGIIK